MTRAGYILAGGLALGSLLLPSTAPACTPAGPYLQSAAGPGGVVSAGGGIYMSITGGPGPGLLLTNINTGETHSLSPVPMTSNGALYIDDYTTHVARYDMPQGLELGGYTVDWEDSQYYGNLEPITLQQDVSPLLQGDVSTGEVEVSQDGHFMDRCDEFWAEYGGEEGAPYVIAELSWELPSVEGGGAFALVTERQSGAYAGSNALKEGPVSLLSSYRWPVESAPANACFTLEIFGTNGETLTTVEHPCVSLDGLPTPTNDPGDEDDGGCTSQKNEMLLPGLLLIPLVGRVRRRRVA